MYMSMRNHHKFFTEGSGRVKKTTTMQPRTGNVLRKNEFQVAKISPEVVVEIPVELVVKIPVEKNVGDQHLIAAVSAHQLEFSLSLSISCILKYGY